MQIWTSRTRQRAYRAPSLPWRINWHSPLARGLSFFYVYHWGRPFDLVTRQFAGAHTAARVPTPHGVMAASVTARYLTGRAPFTIAGGLTMLTVGNKIVGSATTALCQRSGNGIDQVEIRVKSPTSGQIVFNCFDGGTSGLARGLLLPLEEYYWTAGRLPGATATPSIWMDGRDITTEGVAADMSGVSGTLALGGLPDSTAIQYDANKILDAGWNVALGDDELEELTWSNRWGLLIDRKREYFLPAAAAAPGGGTILAHMMHYLS